MTAVAYPNSEAFAMIVQRPRRFLLLPLAGDQEATSFPFFCRSCSCMLTMVAEDVHKLEYARTSLAMDVCKVAIQPAVDEQKTGPAKID